MKATNYAQAQYQEVYDLGTKDGKMTIIGLHTPTGGKPRAMLDGFFKQFRKFCYKGMSVTMIPAAQLPADPLAVGYEAGELQIDPRELVNPILFHGTHGDSLNMALDQCFKNTGFAHTTPSTDITEAEMSEGFNQDAYYAALSDPTFKKFGIQQGVRLKGLHPLVHPVALTRSLVPNADNLNTGLLWNTSGGIIGGMDQIWNGSTDAEGNPNINTNISNQFFTTGVRKLGWLPTRTFYKTARTGTDELPGNITYLPKLFMGVLILPPSYRVEQYFRMVITHYFCFKDFSTALVGDSYSDPKQSYDNFIELSQSNQSVQAMSYEENTIEGNANIQLTTSGVC